MDGYRTESQTESLDEDNLRVDPLEEGIEPPEHWAEANRFGMTPAEARAGEDLDHRLAEEEPDVTVDDLPGPDSPLAELDDRIDEQTTVDTPPEPTHPRHTDAELRGQAADEAGGSVADALREG
ncbi:hypothetical protein [Actinokineospora inagensis]|uniref:hypothetical protein n=1 Tax=Actinokineospora inagensis TaxID=103730 RepID=UPI000413FEAD|nr:hypothetical protein [Actinokineospora inagensis]